MLNTTHNIKITTSAAPNKKLFFKKIERDKKNNKNYAQVASYIFKTNKHCIVNTKILSDYNKAHICVFYMLLYNINNVFRFFAH